MRPLALGLLAAVLGCGGGGGDGSTAPTSTTPPVTTPSAPTPPVTTPAPTSTSSSVVVGNNAYAPNDITVPVGTTVTWTWDACSDDGYGYGKTCVSHSVTFDAGNVASSTQGEGSYQRTFTAAGTYTYHCAVHGVAMSGKVTVK